jgi:hypothetical protein
MAKTLVAILMRDEEGEEVEEMKLHPKRNYFNYSRIFCNSLSRTLALAKIQNKLHSSPNGGGGWVKRGEREERKGTK